MQTVKYNPLRELQNMEQEMDKLWESGWSYFPGASEYSALDLYEENGSLIAEVKLPVFKKEEITVTADKHTLDVTAEHHEEEEKDGKRRYFFRESNNRYSRRITLPDGAVADKAAAQFKNGVLKISMPFDAPKDTKQLEIK